MPFIGNKPSAVPLTSADIADGIITSAKIVDATIANADIANSTINLTTKVTGTLPVANGGTGLAALGTSLQVLRTNTGATGLEFATVSGGKVLQVIQATKVATQTYTGSGSNSPETFSDITDLSISITPSLASSKILILANVMGASSTNSTISAFRGSTNLASPTSPSGRTPALMADLINNIDEFPYTYSIIFLDSPATTSATTYKLAGSTWSGGSLYINRSLGDADGGYNPRGVSTLILMEIGA